MLPDLLVLEPPLASVSVITPQPHIPLHNRCTPQLYTHMDYTQHNLEHWVASVSFALACVSLCVYLCVSVCLSVSLSLLSLCSLSQPLSLSIFSSTYGGKSDRIAHGHEPRRVPPRGREVAEGGAARG